MVYLDRLTVGKLSLFTQFISFYQLSLKHFILPWFFELYEWNFHFFQQFVFFPRLVDFLILSLWLPSFELFWLFLPLVDSLPWEHFQRWNCIWGSFGLVYQFFRSIHQFWHFQLIYQFFDFPHRESFAY